jgi:hypothetical protein
VHTSCPELVRQLLRQIHGAPAVLLGNIGRLAKKLEDRLAGFRPQRLIDIAKSTTLSVQRFTDGARAAANKIAAPITVMQIES